MQSPYVLRLERPGSLLSTVLEIGIDEAELDEVISMLEGLMGQAMIRSDHERVSNLNRQIDSLLSLTGPVLA